MTTTSQTSQPLVAGGLCSMRHGVWYPIPACPWPVETMLIRGDGLWATWLDFDEYRWLRVEVRQENVVVFDVQRLLAAGCWSQPGWVFYADGLLSLRIGEDTEVPDGQSG